MRKVAITGIGLLTCLGNEIKENWEKIKKGESGISPCKEANLPVRTAGYVKSIPLDGRDPFIEYSLYAVKYALKDSNLNLDDFDKTRVGCFVSASKNGLHTVKSQFNNVKSNFWDNFLASSAGMVIKNLYSIKGPVLNYVAACATGVHSLLSAANYIKWGECDIVIAGSTESSLVPIVISGFYNMGVLTTKEMMPYDKERDGFVIAEGSGVIILEEKEHAIRRNAKIYGFLKGGYISNDATHETAFDERGESIAYAINKAISNSNVPKDEIDYINSHGTATYLNDITETRGIKKAFNDLSYKISVSATKPMTGHLLGAAGSVEFIIGLLAMKDSFVPPTINLKNPVDECDLDYTAGKGREKKIRNFMSLSFGFGGHVGVLIGGKE